MIHQELQLTDTIHRFELTTNSSVLAYEKAFSIYGILIIPTLLGVNLMYNVFQLRNEYLTITVSVLVVVLLNIYFFYQKTIIDNYKLKLIIANDQIQLMDNQKIYFQEQLELNTIEAIRCGKNLEPALKLNSEYFQGIIIGLKNTKIDIPIEIEHQLCQPDYWLSKPHQAHAFMKLTGIEKKL